LFSIQKLKSQNKEYVYGKIINQSQESLPFASIIAVGTNKGCISNADGKFRIDRSYCINDSLKIFYLGYNSKSISIATVNDSISITLDKAPVSLNEIVIRSNKNNFAYKLLREVIKKYRNNKNGYKSKAFLSLKSNTTQPVEIFEAFYNASQQVCSILNDLTLKNGRAGLMTIENRIYVSLSTTDILKDYSPFTKNIPQVLPISPTNIRPLLA